jgi:hypothetical protein
VSPIPLGSAWGERDRPPAAKARPGGRIAAAAGGTLALVGLTLPWASIAPAGGAGHRYLAELTDLHPVAAPVAPCLVVLAAAGAAVAFASAGRRASLARRAAVLAAAVGAVAGLVLAVYRVAGSTVVARESWTAGPQRIAADGVLPAVGCACYLLGLLLLGMGAGRSRTG